MTIELVVDFPDYIAEPLPILATNVAGSRFSEHFLGGSDPVTGEL